MTNLVFQLLIYKRESDVARKPTVRKCYTDKFSFCN